MEAQNKSNFGRILGAVLLSGSLFFPGVVFAHGGGHHGPDENGCTKVRGKFSSSPAAPCASPVGFCTAGSLTGKLKSNYAFTMATSVPAGDATIPSVFFYTGQSIITFDDGTTLIGTDAGNIDLNPFGHGKFTALINVIDGTGDRAGSTGYLQLRGTVDFESGGASGDYRGEVCAP